MKGFVTFVMRRSIAAIITLVVIVALTVAIMQFSLCAQIDAILVQIRQQIDQEIIDNKLVFDTLAERQSYIDMRMRQEIAERGLDACV